MDMLTLPDAAAWRDWLERHHGDSDGVWLVTAKKGVAGVSRDEALEEALCHGWIDGQARSRDDATYLQRYTPRRPRSAWSQRNTKIVERLTAEGRMRPAGLAEVERAKADGRWDAAYAGSATSSNEPGAFLRYGWSLRPSASISTYCAIRRARVSGRLASWIRYSTA